MQLPVYNNIVAGGKVIQSDSIQIANYLNEKGYDFVYYIDPLTRKNNGIWNGYTNAVILSIPIWPAITHSIPIPFAMNYNLPFQIKEIGSVWFLLALLWALLTVKFFVNVENGWIYVGVIAYKKEIFSLLSSISYL